MQVFSSKGDNIVVEAPYVEFYIPMYYFDSANKYAIDKGKTIDLLGIFNVGIFKDGKMVEMKTFNIATWISINVYDSELNEVKLLDGNVTQCKVIKYLKGANVMHNKVIENDEYVKTYLKFLTGGKAPKLIPYSKIFDVWMSNQKLNGVSFGLPAVYLETILSVLYRNPDDLSEKFSKIANNKDVSEYGYATASIRQICQYNSTFTALTYEDFDSMLTTSLNKTREKKKERYTPVENIIKY